MHSVKVFYFTDMKKFSHILFCVFTFLLIVLLVACGNEKTQAFESNEPNIEESNGSPQQSIVDNGQEKNDTLILNAISSPVSQSKALITDYISSARSAYKGSDYTSSIIANYRTTASDFNDRPLAVTLSYPRSLYSNNAG